MLLVAVFLVPSDPRSFDANKRSLGEEADVGVASFATMASWSMTYGVRSDDPNNFFKSTLNPNIPGRKATESHRIALPRQPFHLSRTPSTLAVRTPEFAEHTDELLREFGFSAAEIKQFRERGVVE